MLKENAATFVKPLFNNLLKVLVEVTLVWVFDCFKAYVIFYIE